MHTITKPTILIIIGISGDLSKRKLLPAIARIASMGLLPEKMRIVGTSRRDIDVAEIVPDNFPREMLDIVTVDTTDEQGYIKLAEHLRTIEDTFGSPAQRLFYLSVPPGASGGIISLLGTSGLSKVPDTKLLLEKPFGRDLQSATELIAEIHTHFTEDQVYRIDHYLAKEMAQNLVIFRAKNALFKHTWNNKYIESIEIIASEMIGIEGRTGFYEQTGALRDFVQSHLLQLVALILMDLPDDSGMAADMVEKYWQDIPAQRLAALRALTTSVVNGREGDMIRAQYEGYREAVGNPDSQTETFVSLLMSSSNETWKGVPIRVTTGKALSKKTTEIRIQYRRDTSEEANTLTLRIQPKEGVQLCMWVKKPGYAHEVEKLSMDFSYGEHFTDVPEAYERVFVDAMKSDHSLFTTSDEVIASWNILAPVQEAWEKDPGSLKMYTQGEKVEKVGK